MYIRRDEHAWSAPDAFGTAFAEHLQKLLASLESSTQRFVKRTPDGGPTVRARALPFYSGISAKGAKYSGAYLVGFDLDTDTLKALDEDLRLLSSEIWYVIGERGPAPETETRPDPAGAPVSNGHASTKEDAKTAVPRYDNHLMNGTSPPIHSFNNECGGVNLDHASEYLDFFCTFVNGEAGPFQNLHAIDDVIWPEDWSENVLPEPLLAKKKEIAAFSEIQDALSVGYDVAVESVDDLKNLIESRIDGLTGTRPLIEDDSKNFSLRDQTIEILKEQASAPATTGQTQSSYLTTLISYGNALFRAAFEIKQDGTIEMLDDSLIKGASNLPIAASQFRSNFEKGSLQQPIFLHLAPPPDPVRSWDERGYAQLRAAQISWEQNQRNLEFQTLNETSHRSDQDDVYEPGAVIIADARCGSDTDQDGVPSSGVRMELGTAPAEDAKPKSKAKPKVSNYSGETFYRPIIFRNIVFLNDFIISEALFEKSVTFENCTFFGRFLARNVQIKGSLSFKDCRLRALSDVHDDFTSRAEFALDLEDAVIAKNISIVRSTIQGMLTLRGARIEGRGRILSSIISPPYVKVTVDDEEAKGKSLPDAQAEGSEADPSQDAKKVERIRVALFRGEKKFKTGGLELKDCYFGGSLDIGQFGEIRRDASFGKDDPFTPTLVVGELRADNLRSEGSLNLLGLVTTSFTESLVYRTPQEQDEIDRHRRSRRGGVQPYLLSTRTDVRLSGAKVRGNLRVWKQSERLNESWEAAETIIGGEFDLTESEFGGTVDLRGIWVEEGLNLGRCRLSNQVLLSTMGFSTYFFQQSKIDGVEDKPLFAVPKPLLIPDRRDGSKGYSLWRNGRTYIGKDLDLRGTHIGSDCYISGAHIKGQIKGAGCQIDGSFIAAAMIDYFPPVSTQKNNVSALFEASREASLDQNWFDESSEQFTYLKSTQRSCCFVSLEKAADPEQENGQWLRIHGFQVLQTDAAGIHFRDAHIGGEIDFSGCRLGDRDSASSQTIGGTLKSCLVFDNMDIRGSVKFSDWTLQKAITTIRGNHYQSYLASNVFDLSDETPDLSDRAIAELIRRVLDFDHTAMHALGSIEILNSTVDSRLDLTGLTVLEGNLKIHDARVNGDVIAYGSPKEYEKTLPHHEDLKTRARGLHIEMLRCDGDMHLTGLELSEGLLCENITIAGETRLVSEDFAETESNGRAMSYARVADDLILQGSVFQRLTLHGGSTENEISLARTTINELKVVVEIPSNVDLRRARFDYLTFEDGLTDDDKTYTDLLDKQGQDKFSPEPYAMVETMLKTQGKSAAARRVYKAMMERQAKARFRTQISKIGPRFLVAPLAWFGTRFLYGWLTGFGTGWLRLGLIGTALIFASTALMAAPENFSRQYVDETDLTSEQCLSAYGPGLTISIPVISLQSDDVNTNTLNNMAVDQKPVFAWGCLLPVLETDAQQALHQRLNWGPSARSLAITFSVLGWIVWPMFVLSLTGFIRREG
ncbi:MAG: hypothetical protein AAF582_06305 [Pseudomonadota bacterium]